jgi:hypothetical protein
MVGALLVVPAAAGSAQAVHAAAPTGPAPQLVQVGGAAIDGISSAPMVLTPTFQRTTHDYALRCSAGTNTVQLTISGAGGDVVLGPVSSRVVVVDLPLAEGQAAVVAGSDGQQYWLRCLPHDFPQLVASRPGTPTTGYYLTGNITTGGGDGRYAMILDTNGTPVWYAATQQGALNVEQIGSELAWAGSTGATYAASGYTVNALDGSATAVVSAVGMPTDEHEFLPLSGGGYALLAAPLVNGVDLSAIGLGTNQTIIDCVVQEVGADGSLLWQWRLSDHVAPSESQHPQQESVNGVNVWDIYHCNSVDDNGTGQVLVSARETDAVFDVDRASGAVLWKLGGTSTNKDGAPILSTAGDPQGGPSGQHDARFLPNGDISMYDDQSFGSGPARGVEYSIDTAGGRASVVWQTTSPTGQIALATGSFRRYADGESVIGWGFLGTAGFSEVNGRGATQLEVSFPNGDHVYRALKVPAGALDIGTLRLTAGRVSGAAPVPAQLTFPPQPTTGYVLAGADGAIYPFGIAGAHGDVQGIPLNQPVVGAAEMPDDFGYWLVAADGGVFPYGDAGGYGSTGNVQLNRPIVGMAATPSGHGYWLVASDGGVFPFGDAGGYGSTGDIQLNQPVVGMAATPDGGGYWLVAADGGIFPFGDAGGYGSTGSIVLNKPTVGMAATPDGRGYWLVASDGGIFPFGDAGGYGSTGSVTLNQPMVGMASTQDGGGYWLVAADGGIFPFGDAPGLGSTGSTPLGAPIVAMARA